jgi:uncharacterized protein YpbB
MSNLNWEPEARQPARLKSAVEKILDILEKDPTNRLVRTKSLRTRTGYTIWKVPVRERFEDWSLIWIFESESESEVLILYLGPANYEDN